MLGEVLTAIVTPFKDDQSIDYDRFRELAVHLVDHGSDGIVVADLDGEVVGLAHLQVTPTIEYDRPAAKIGALVVDESHRGEGVGRRLVDALEAEARARGCCLLFLTTSVRRADAHEFYRRVGLEETGKRFTKSLP